MPDSERAITLTAGEALLWNPRTASEAVGRLQWDDTAFSADRMGPVSDEAVALAGWGSGDDESELVPTVWLGSFASGHVSPLRFSPRTPGESISRIEASADGARLIIEGRTDLDSDVWPPPETSGRGWHWMRVIELPSSRLLLERQLEGRAWVRWLPDGEILIADDDLRIVDATGRDRLLWSPPAAIDGLVAADGPTVGPLGNIRVLDVDGVHWTIDSHTGAARVVGRHDRPEGFRPRFRSVPMCVGEDLVVWGGCLDDGCHLSAAGARRPPVRLELDEFGGRWALSADQRLAAAVGGRPGLRIYDLARDNPARSGRGCHLEVTDTMTPRVALDRRGERGLSVAADGVINVFELASGELLERLRPAEAQPAPGPAVEGLPAPHGETLVVVTAAGIGLCLRWIALAASPPSELGRTHVSDGSTWGSSIALAPDGFQAAGVGGACIWRCDPSRPDVEYQFVEDHRLSQPVTTWRDLSASRVQVLDVCFAAADQLALATPDGVFLAPSDGGALVPTELEGPAWHLCGFGNAAIAINEDGTVARAASGRARIVGNVPPGSHCLDASLATGLVVVGRTSSDAADDSQCTVLEVDSGSVTSFCLDFVTQNLTIRDDGHLLCVASDGVIYDVDWRGLAGTTTTTR